MFDSNKSATKVVLKRKIAALSLVAVLAFAVFLIVRHYFYLLDSYYYTAEFHMMFIENNLKKADAGLFTDYFRSMQSMAKVFPMLLLSYLVQSLWLPFTKHVLFSSTTFAFGIPQGAALSYASFLTTALVCYGIGIFFLGDIIPLLREKMLRIQSFVFNKSLTGGILAVLFAVPLVPISFPAFLGAFIRVPLGKILVIMILGFVLRLTWFIVTGDGAVTPDLQTIK
jgi:hypothetical protein